MIPKEINENAGTTLNRSRYRVFPPDDSGNTAVTEFWSTEPGINALSLRVGSLASITIGSTTIGGRLIL